jgi:iron complex transport system permease protein
MITSKKGLPLIFFAFISLLVGISSGSGGWISYPFESARHSFIFWELRVPRALLAFLVGGGLGTCGLVFQSLFRNALAGPFTLGVASGASFGACLGIFLSSSLGLYFSWGLFSSVTVLSFLGALLSVSIILGLSRFKNGFRPTVLILCGVISSFFFSSLILFLQFMAQQYDAKKMLQWIMGDLGVVGYSPSILLGIACLLVLYLVKKKAGILNIISVGEVFAQTRGINVDRERRVLFVTTSALVGVIVSFVGPISFVGLILPHWVKARFGHKLEDCLGPCFLGAGSFLVICDCFSRIFDGGSGLPVGVITSFIGGPYFLYILLKDKSL